LAGLLATQEIPNLKELFYDEAIGTAAVHSLGEKYVIHSEIFGERSKEKLTTVQQISAMIDEGFRNRGINKLHTWAETEEQYRFNLFLGYKPTGNEVTIPDYPNPVYEFEKEL